MNSLGRPAKTRRFNWLPLKSNHHKMSNLKEGSVARLTRKSVSLHPVSLPDHENVCRTERTISCRGRPNSFHLVMRKIVRQRGSLSRSFFKFIIFAIIYRPDASSRLIESPRLEPIAARRDLHVSRSIRSITYNWPAHADRSLISIAFATGNGSSTDRLYEMLDTRLRLTPRRESNRSIGHFSNAWL